MQSDKEFLALKESYFPAALSAFYFENRYWGLPYIYNPEAFFYNADLFEAAGLKTPNGSWGQDEFIAAALKLTRDRDGNGVTDQWGFTSGNVWTHVWRAGGSIWDNDSAPRRSVLDSQQAIDGLRFFQDLIYRYRVRPAPSVWNVTSERSLFLNGNAATYTEGAWTIREFSKVLPFKWGVTAFPRWRKQVNLAYVSGIAAYARTKHPREAWELVKFYAGPQAQEIQIEGQLATIPIMDMDIGIKPTPYTLGIFEAARAGRLEPPVLDMNEYRRIVGTGVGALLNNTQGPVEAATYMAENLTRLIQRLNR